MSGGGEVTGGVQGETGRGGGASPPPGEPTSPRTAGRAEARLRAAGPALAVAAAALLAHAGSLGVPLLFDDLPNIVDQPSVHALDLSPGQLAPALRGFPFGRWLARLSFAIDHAIHGLRPAGYHAVNVLLHLAASLLVLALARRLLDGLARRRGEGEGLGWAHAPAAEQDRRRAALIAALIFAVHPVQTQAVTYVVQRMTVMGACFALAALVLWLGARGRSGAPRARRVAGAVLCAWLAVSCKENYVVLPGIVLLLEAVLEPGLVGRLRARGRAVAAGAAALVAAGGLLAWAYAPVIRAEHARLRIPVAERLLSQGRILLHYLSLLALPLPGRLHVDYAWPPSTGLLEPASTLPALLAVAALAALAVASVRRAPLVALGAGWFLVALAVEQSVLPIDLVFEQRLYFAGIGLWILAGAALVALVRVPRVVWAVAAPVVLLLAAGTWVRDGAWRDPARLFADEAGVGPGSARGLLTVAATLRTRGRLDEAERVLRRLVAIAPDEPGAYVNLGNVALDRGRLEEAERHYRTALARNPRMGDAWFDLGVALSRANRLPEAMDAYREAIACDPGYASARVNLALLQLRGGDANAALATLDEALRIDPGAVSALSNRAVIRAKVGRRPEALADARRAVELAPDRSVPWMVLAQLELQVGRYPEAKAAAAKALQLDPRSKDAQELYELISRPR
jgi:tetratricopeptide (TPR) repeat protein